MGAWLCDFILNSSEVQRLPGQGSSLFKKMKFKALKVKPPFELIPPETMHFQPTQRQRSNFIHC
jgi:hypothetical protein